MRGVSRVVDLIKARVFRDTPRGPRAVSSDLGLPIELADGPMLDAFHRQRVSNLAGLFDSQNQYDTSPLLWDTLATAGGTEAHDPNSSSVVLNVDTTADASFIRQTRQYIRYQPGRSQLIAMTFVFGIPATNVKQKIGYFDAANGVFFQMDGTGALSFNLRSSVSGAPVDETVPQASWSLDRLDSGGPSRVRIVPGNGQILIIDLQWLGLGRVRVGFDVGTRGNPRIVYAHEFTAANVISDVYMTTANLPLRYEITATGAAGSAASLQQVCQSVSSEGGFETERGNDFGDGNLTVVTPVGAGAWVPLISIRPKATFNAIVNRAMILPEFTEVLAGSGSGAWCLFYDPTTLTGGAWASVHASSVVESNLTATALTGGIPAAFGQAAGGAGNVRNVHSRDLGVRYPLTLDISGANPKVLTLAGRSHAGNIDMSGAINWTELR